MPFRLSIEARSYYDEVESDSSHGSFDTLWDQYYFSGMAGIRARSRAPGDEVSGLDPFMNRVIQDYENQKYEIYSALIVAEVERRNIPWSEKDEIKDLMLKILDSTESTRLTPKGTKILNCYAEQGYRIISSNIPTSIKFSEFLREYHNLISTIDKRGVI